MINTVKSGQILFTGITVDELLLQIEQIIESKISTRPENEKIQSDFLSRQQVASLLKISLPTLNEWSKLGWLQSYKIGNRVLYKLPEVEQALNKVGNLKHRKGGHYEKLL